MWKMPLFFRKRIRRRHVRRSGAELLLRYQHVWCSSDWKKVCWAFRKLYVHLALIAVLAIDIIKASQFFMAGFLTRILSNILENSISAYEYPSPVAWLIRPVDDLTVARRCVYHIAISCANSNVPLVGNDVSSSELTHAVDSLIASCTLPIIRGHIALLDACLI